mmetsp:Transcript_66572/g.215157  ORF Transcript_66572/g.215157 Transcript_66572/m.215157 type:complete len:282 (-) Transcript_66572:527-1372(-)
MFSVLLLRLEAELPQLVETDRGCMGDIQALALLLRHRDPRVARGHDGLGDARALAAHDQGPTPVARGQVWRDRLRELVLGGIDAHAETPELSEGRGQRLLSEVAIHPIEPAHGDSASAAIQAIPRLTGGDNRIHPQVEGGAQDLPHVVRGAQPVQHQVGRPERGQWRRDGAGQREAAAALRGPALEAPPGRALRASRTRLRCLAFPRHILAKLHDEGLPGDHKDLREQPRRQGQILGRCPLRNHRGVQTRPRPARLMRRLQLLQTIPRVMHVDNATAQMAQ